MEDWGAFCVGAGISAFTIICDCGFRPAFEKSDAEPLNIFAIGCVFTIGCAAPEQPVLAEDPQITLASR
jgi:hypothetical protein